MSAYLPTVSLDQTYAYTYLRFVPMKGWFTRNTVLRTVLFSQICVDKVDKTGHKLAGKFKSREQITFRHFSIVTLFLKNTKAVKALLHVLYAAQNREGFSFQTFLSS